MLSDELPKELSDEREAISTELSPPFTLENGDALATPFVFCSPHSGRVYPRSFLDRSKLDPLTLRRSEDCFVDHLFAPAAKALRAPLISARFPRAYLDVNREPYELDAKLFREPLPEFANQYTPRVVGGLGTIARVVADGEEIYEKPLPLAVAFERIEKLYKPFHAALTDLLEARLHRFGHAILFDCHSMPSTAVVPSPDERPDIVLGDRFGVSCDGAISQKVKRCLQDLGYSVQMNRPYAGGFITQHYGRPAYGCHAIQIEINRGLYVNEQQFEPTMGFSRLERDLATMAQRIHAQLPDLSSRPLAAE